MFGFDALKVVARKGFICCGGAGAGSMEKEKLDSSQRYTAAFEKVETRCTLEQ